MKKTKVKWLRKPQKHDYPSAQSYLSLTVDPRVAKNLADALERAEMREYAAKDIFRASRLSLLDVSNSHVEKDRSRIILNEALSPLLLCRANDHGKLIIADGYHRLCAVYEPPLRTPLHPSDCSTDSAFDPLARLSAATGFFQAVTGDAGVLACTSGRAVRVTARGSNAVRAPVFLRQAAQMLLELLKPWPARWLPRTLGALAAE